MSKQAVPTHEKFLITIEEAQAYFGIGRDKLYALTKEEGCKFVLFVGRTRLIKRECLESYLKVKTYI